MGQGWVDMSNTNHKNMHLNALRESYGELMTLDDVVEVFRYKSKEAVRKAHQRGTLPVSLYRFPNRSGWLAKTVEVAKCIDDLSLS